MPETLFLTHNLIDRFLSKKVVTRKNLQVREGPVTKRSIRENPRRSRCPPYPPFALN